MHKHYLPVTCPLCGHKCDRPLDSLREGLVLECPFCKVKLTLHGHMWEDIQAEIEKLNEKQ